ncbi:hypothetical protein V3C99_007416 [Haemonchus contortus]
MDRNTSRTRNTLL